MNNKTIYALSTVYGRSGVAVIRISGNDAKEVIKKMTSLNIKEIKSRYAYFVDLKDIKKQEIIDKRIKSRSTHIDEIGNKISETIAKHKKENPNYQ